MKKILLLFLIYVAMLNGVWAKYSGYVYINNENKTLSGVAVSDGLHVTLTDKNGFFTLPGHAREKFIFITIPAGYKAKENYYLPIQSEKDNYNFTLLPYTERVAKNGAHNFIQITDTEIFNTDDHEKWINNLRNYAEIEQAAFIIHTGDICYEKGLKEHIQIMNTSNMGRPVFYCIGNHDLVKGNYGEQLYESIYGPVFYSFDVGNIHYIVTPMLHGDHRSSYTKEDVYRWLKNDLAHISKEKSVIVFSHDLLTYSDRFIYGINDTEFIDLNDYDLKAWIYGHWHINYMKKQGNVFSICTGTLDKGGIDHSTSAFRQIKIARKNQLTSELRYTYTKESIEIASIQAENAFKLPNGNIPVSVNIYDADSPVQRVYFGYSRNGKMALIKRDMQKQTDWNWYAQIAAKEIKEGEKIDIQVTARLKDGRKLYKEASFIYSSDMPKVNFTDDWTNLLGNPEHIGIAASKSKATFQPLWLKNIGANIFMTSPIIYKGNIYIASVDENAKGNSKIVALDGKNGEIIWQYTTRNSVKNTIVACQELIFAQDVEGNVYAVDAKTGKLQWEKKLTVNGLPALIEGLVATDSLIFAGTGKGLCAIEALSGNILWTNTDWIQGEGTTSTWTVGNNVLICGAQWSGLYAHNAQTGELLWKNNKNGLRHRGASVAIQGHLGYLISESSFFILDIYTGHIIVRKELPFKVDVTSTPLLTDNEILFGSSDSGLIALDKETLELKWKFQTQPALIYTAPYTRYPFATMETSPVLIGENIYFGASDGNLYAIHKNNGELIAKHTTGAPIFSSIAISGNILVSADFSGNVYTFMAE